MTQQNPNLIAPDDPALQNLKFVQREPITAAGAPPAVSDRYQGGTISGIGLQTDTADSQLPGPLPVYRLMPSSVSGSAAAGAAATSNLLKNPTFITNQKQIQQNADAIAALQNVGFQGAWDATTSYAKGAEADYLGVIYTSLIDDNLNNQPDISPSDWQSSGTSTFEGTWDSATAYVPGNSVVYTDPSTNTTAFYICIADSTNNPPSTSPTFWQVTGSSSTYVFLGAYSPTTAYYPGNQVTYNPSGGGTLYWICIANTTGNAPTQASSFWELVGTSAANLNGLDGVAPQAPGGNRVFNGDFSIATVPTGVQSATASAIRVQDPQSGGSILQPSCNGWTRNFESQNAGEGYTFQTTVGTGVGLASPYQLVLQDTTSGGNDDFAVVSDAFTVNQGQSYNFSATLYVGFATGLPANATWYFRVLWYKQGATNFSRSSSDLISLTDIVSASTATGLQTPSATLTAPATAGFCRIAFYHWSTGAVSSVWNLLVTNVKCLEVLSNTPGAGVPDGPSNFSATASTLTYRPTFNPLTATASSSATISIASFTMLTSSKGSVSVSSGSVTGLSFGTLYYIYYDDPTLVGGGVTFNATTTKTTAINGAGRFYVGSIYTPVSGGVSTVGNNDGGVGAQLGSQPILFGGTSTQSNVSGTPTISNLGNLIDGDTTTFAEFLTTSTSQAQGATISAAAFSPTSGPYSSMTLYVTSSVPTNPASGISVTCEYSLDGGNTFTTIWSVAAGTTRALTTDTASIPAAQNLGLLVVRFRPNRTAGTVIAQLNMYDVRVLALT